MYTSTVTAALEKQEVASTGLKRKPLSVAGTGKDNLEKTYKKPIHEIVAVVTPFKAQEAEIRHQIQKYQEMRNIKI